MVFHNCTIRQTLRLSTGGQHLRVKISNTFGLSDLRVAAVTIAIPKEKESERPIAGSRAILLDTVQPLSFNHQSFIDIPSGALVVSDPVRFSVHPTQVITVSIFMRHGQTGGQVTSHPGSRTETWISHGDHTMAEDMNGPNTQSTFHWYFLSGIEVWQPAQNCALVLVGDSVTDGRCSTDNQNNRWPDLLFDLMLHHKFAQNIAVLNQAAGGNRMLRDEKGPNVLSRLDRDIFAQPGVRYVMIFHGVNDIGTAESDTLSQQVIGDRLIQAYKQIISRVHAFGIPVFCSTIGPFMAPNTSIQSYAEPTREQTRQRINHWIRNSGAFDAVIDFDRVLRDHYNPSYLNPEYNSGDYLHPNVKAFHAMAGVFPLDIFEKFSNGIEIFD